MPHTASVWLLDTGELTDAALAPFVQWLDESEAERLGCFARPGRRRQFLAGRALARLALGQLLGMPAAAVRLIDRHGQAPLLALPGHESVGFSISHSDRWVACAFSATTQLGLDIEHIDPNRDIDALAAQAFDAEQQAFLSSRPAATRVRAFYSLWSAMEARFKLGRPGGQLIEMAHPELSVALCCEHAPLSPPTLQVVTLDQ